MLHLHDGTTIDIKTRIKMNSAQFSEKQISAFSNEYKLRRKQQMLRFFCATALTLVSSRVAYRGMLGRKCMLTIIRISHIRGFILTISFQMYLTCSN